MSRITISHIVALTAVATAVACAQPKSTSQTAAVGTVTAKGIVTYVGTGSGNAAVIGRYLCDSGVPPTIAKDVIGKCTEQLSMAVGEVQLKLLNAYAAQYGSSDLGDVTSTLDRVIAQLRADDVHYVNSNEELIASQLYALLPNVMTDQSTISAGPSTKITEPVPATEPLPVVNKNFSQWTVNNRSSSESIDLITSPGYSVSAILGVSHADFRGNAIEVKVTGCGSDIVGLGVTTLLSPAGGSMQFVSHTPDHQSSIFQVEGGNTVDFTGVQVGLSGAGGNCTLTFTAGTLAKEEVIVD